MPATAGEIFAAYGVLPVRKKWFRMPGKPVGEHELDFTVGGGVSLAATFAPMGDQSELLEYRSRFLDIAFDERIVFAYTFDLVGR
ncbi:MAG: SRPBCC family protein, partial [Acidimicrobiales bacterium]